MGLFSRRKHQQAQEINLDESSIATQEQPQEILVNAEVNQQTAPETAPAPAAQEVAVSDQTTQGQPQQQEDWLNDYQGQLTIDVYQTDDSIVVKSTIAGVQPQDLDVSINGDMLSISGERGREQKVKDEDYFYQECYWGAFSRSVILPMNVQADKIAAELKDGILTVTLPKASNEKVRKINVISAS